MDLDADLESALSHGGEAAVSKFPNGQGTSTRHGRRPQSDREDLVFDALIEVLEETPEALSPEYSDDFLCDLIRSLVPDVTGEEIVTALNVLGSRAIALRDVMKT
jgi:hypothetical protein